jgi:hypothetical protein
MQETPRDVSSRCNWPNGHVGNDNDENQNSGPIRELARVKKSVAKNLNDLPQQSHQKVESVVIHDHDHVQKLLIARTPIGQTGMHCRLDQYAASAACTRNLLLERDPIEEGASWVDLASAGQLDPPPSVAGTKGDQKLGLGKEN